MRGPSGITHPTQCSVDLRSMSFLQLVADAHLCNKTITVTQLPNFSKSNGKPECSYLDRPSADEQVLALFLNGPNRITTINLSLSDLSSSISQSQI